MAEYNYTESEIRAMIQGRKSLDAAIRAYFWERYEADPDWQKEWIATPNIESIEIEGDEISIECEQRACNRGCCGSDYRTYTIPTEYLWLDQTAILADMKAKAEAAKARKVEAERKRKVREAKAQEVREVTELKRLQAKYGSAAGEDGPKVKAAKDRWAAKRGLPSRP